MMTLTKDLLAMMMVKMMLVTMMLLTTSVQQKHFSSQVSSVSWVSDGSRLLSSGGKDTAILQWAML